MLVGHKIILNLPECRQSCSHWIQYHQIAWDLGLLYFSMYVQTLSCSRSPLQDRHEPTGFHSPVFYTIIFLEKSTCQFCNFVLAKAYVLYMLFSCYISLLLGMFKGFLRGCKWNSCSKESPKLLTQYTLWF